MTIRHIPTTTSRPQTENRATTEPCKLCDLTLELMEAPPCRIHAPEAFARWAPHLVRPGTAAAVLHTEEARAAGERTAAWQAMRDQLRFELFEQLTADRQYVAALEKRVTELERLYLDGAVDAMAAELTAGPGPADGKPGSVPPA